ncbi:MAG: outer membrane protein assembly factor BamA [Candidatus Babeliales bacterium]
MIFFIILLQLTLFVCADEPLVSESLDLQEEVMQEPITPVREETVGSPDKQEAETSESVAQEEQEDASLDFDAHAHDDAQDQEQFVDEDNAPVKEKYIAEIIVEGNKRIPLQAIISRVPYRSGEIFSPQKSNKLVRNLYDLGYFRQVEVYVEDVDAESLNLIVSVDEKRVLEEVRFFGNYNLSEKEIKKKLDFSKVSCADEDDIPKYIKVLKKLYRDKDFHDVDIKAELQGDGERVTLIFTINEGKRTLVKRVRFTGNNYFQDKKLRSILFTREDWVLGFLDRAGSFQPEAVEADKQVIENYYQSNGFFNAKVTDVTFDLDEETKDLTVVFHIFEGEQYRISQVRAPGNEVVTQEQLLDRIPIRPGQLYSREMVRETIELLRLIWGEFGYINADIEPSVQPNEDEKTVALSFYSELGPRIYLNRITIIGNEKTYDKVIRRQLTVEEGCILTTKAMDESKSRVEGLGFFDTRDGVNWRIIPVAKDRVDLELIVKEVRTGRMEAQMGFGGTPRDISSPTESFNVTLNVADTNLFGRGIQVNASASLSKEERNLLFNITQPWLFDRPIHATGDLFIKRSIYDDFAFIKQPQIDENITGGTTGIGFLSRKLWDTTVAYKLGVEGITYKQTPEVTIGTVPGLNPQQITALELELQNIMDKRFTSGAFLWFGGYAFKDLRNHPLHPSRGYQYSMFAKLAVHSNLKDNPRDNVVQNIEANAVRKRYGFLKVDFDASWFTPLIGERDLVLGLHAHMGIVGGIGKKTIPFRELYHIGGPGSVRGFLYGEIGPVFVVPQLQKSDMLGAKKAFWLNAEMVFPISKDFSMKGAVFYDGGAGWDTPDSHEISPANLRNNSFAFRHAVGFGVRILRPTPIKIDWGFKLDPKRGETKSQVHFSMYQDF